MRRETRIPARRQRGTSVIEVLIACGVVALGAVSTAWLQRDLQLGADTSRQRGEARRLAQRELEQMRAYTVLAATPGQRSYAAIVSAPVDADPVGDASSNAAYAVERSVDDTSAGYKSATVTVRWSDRGGSERDLSVHSIVGGSPPELVTALTVANRPAAERGPFGRSVLIPLNARDLGNGSSAWKPLAGGSVALVFDNASGRITARCSGVAASVETHRLTLAALGRCEVGDAALLGGLVRMSLSEPPDPGHAVETPLALSVRVTGGACTSEAQQVVAFDSGDGVRRQAVALTATPASVGAAAWTPLGDRYVAYHCTVPLQPGPAGWSGRSSIVAHGWTIGTAATHHRVCRYTGDPDADHAVTGPPMQQNFLIVRGDQRCPGSAGLTTVQHQP